MEAIYSVTTNKGFEETVAAVEDLTEKNGFRVLHVHDVKKTLAEKDFNIESLKIIEVCNARYAYSALTIDLTVSMLLPCRINVYTDTGKTIISTVKPTALTGIFNKPELTNFAKEVEEVLLKIIDGSK